MKNFKLKIKFEPEFNDKINLLTSHNGNQWSGGAPMTLEELEQIRDAITGFLNDSKASGG